MTLDLLAAYRTMLRIRLVEDRLQKLCLEGLAGDLHFSKGQEAIAVGVCAALRPGDIVVTHHRTIAHEIARGAALYPLIAEVLGRKTGINGGRAGEMHLHNAAVNHRFSFQLVGTCLPVAAGIAWGEKCFRKSDNIVVCFIGDAASSNAQFHEGMTIAALQKVPLLVVCENNELAGNIRPEHYLPTESVSSRIGAYDIRGRIAAIDGNHVDVVSHVAEHVVAQVRRESRLGFLECMTTRLCWHKQGQRDVRSEEELKALAEHDPLRGFDSSIGQEAMALAHDEIGREVNEATTRALADGPPEFEEGR
jgi:TPP-dependent pyruvate/acetoin dehydrogenase alpha subunit